MQSLRCTYSLTTNIDITCLRSEIKKLNKTMYPVLIYMLASVVNQYQEFRMNTDSEGRLGYWDQLNPGYTIFNKEKETFASIWTKYNPSFCNFYDTCTGDIASYSSSTVLMPKPNEPQNLFNISSLPWTSFTSLILMYIPMVVIYLQSSRLVNLLNTIIKF